MTKNDTFSLKDCGISVITTWSNICDMKFVFPAYAYRYVCLGGSTSPTPSDGSHGYSCPAGHSCPVGSAIEVPCEPGTYSPMPGAAHCIICPKGTMCSSSATQEPLICPAGEDGENQTITHYTTPSYITAVLTSGKILNFFNINNKLIFDNCYNLVGHFCPAGTALPQPCPIGTLSNQTGAHSPSVCTACPSGVYCSSYGASTPQGADIVEMLSDLIFVL